jgi:hypothetical protein
MRRLAISQLLVLLALVSGIPLQAGTLYRLSWNVVTAMVFDDTTDLGTFKIGPTPGTAEFQGSSFPGNFTWTMSVPVGVLQPGSPERTWSSGTGDDAFTATLFIPLPDGLGGYSIQPYVIDSTNIEYASYIVTNQAPDLRFNGGAKFAGRFSTETTLTMLGLVSPGSAGAPDSIIATATIRDGSYLVRAKLSGTAMAPEPSTGLTALAGALLLMTGAAVSRVRRVGARGTSK